MANQLPRDVLSLPRWARDLIDHMICLPGMNIEGYCIECGYPTVEGYICSCGCPHPSVEYSTRFEGLNL